MLNYPNEIATLQTNTKTLGVEAYFQCRDLNESSPMKVFADNSLSRYTFTILENKKAVQCNVSIDKIENITHRTQYAYNRHMDNEFIENDNQSIAFTRKFMAGSLKGKSPADVLRENGEKGKDILNEQYKWLKGNLEKFPRNRDLMDAIIAASKLTEEELQNTNSTKQRIDLITIGVRPQTRKQREDGKCLCREMEIGWNIGSNYPVNIRIKNYYAPVIKRDNGTLNVKISEKADEEQKDFNVSAEDWMNIIEMMQMSKKAFYNSVFPKAYKNVYENVNEWKKEQTS